MTSYTKSNRIFGHTECFPQAVCEGFVIDGNAAEDPDIQIQGLHDSVDWNQKLDLPFVNDV